MSFLNKTAEKTVPCCTLVILGMQTIGFLFEKEQVLQQASPKFDFLHANTKYTRSTPYPKHKIYM